MTRRVALIVSACSDTRSVLEELFLRSRIELEMASTLESWLENAQPESVQCMVLDTVHGGLSDAEILTGLARVSAVVPVLVLTAAGDVPTAVQAIRHGARDVMQKPAQPSRIQEWVDRVVSQVR